MKLFFATLLLSTSAWSYQDIFLRAGESVRIGNYQVTCDPYGQMDTASTYVPSGCPIYAQFINDCFPTGNARITASCSGANLIVRVSGLGMGQSARFRTNDINIQYARELAHILNTMNSNTLSIRANITSMPGNPGYGYVGYSVSK